MKKLLLLFFMSSFLFACEDSEKVLEQNKTKKSSLQKNIVTKQSTANKDKESAAELFQQSAKILFKFRAVSASLYGVKEKLAGYHYQSQLENYSPENEKKFRQEMRVNAKKITALAADKSLGENAAVVENITSYYAGDDKISAGYIDSWMGHSAFIVNQINGPMIDVPNNLINSHSIKNLADAKDYIKRLSEFKSMADSILKKIKSDAAKNWVPPKVIIKKAAIYLHGFTKIAAKNSPLVKAFVRKISKLKLSAVLEKQLVQEAVEQVSDSVYPAFVMIANEMDELYPQGKENAGIWAQPDGAEFYQYEISQLGDTDLTAKEIHQVGLKEVARITVEMDKILKQQGYSTGTVGQRMESLSRENRFLYPNTDKGREALLNDLNGIISSIKVKMSKYFKSIPPYPVVVKRIPVATEESSAGGYYTPPTLDGSTPGIYWINLRDTRTNPKFDLKSLSYHEAIPGHHWQVSLNLAQKQLPFLRRIAPYNAYVEGWALYAERLAFEMGMYQNDPFGNLGRLKAELFRAVRLVVDTGIHYKRWSREKAIDYMAATTGTEISDVVSEIERYMAWPAQALGYKLGMMKIRSLRQYAKAQLGSQFDLKAFHDEVLLGGAVPMKVLDEKIKNWVRILKQRNK